MAAKTLQQVLETHDKIVQGFEKHRKTLSRTRPTGSRLVVKQKRTMLAHIDQRLENAVKARNDAIKRHDAAIARIELSRNKLADEIAADEKKLSEDDGGSGGGDVTRPTRPTRPTGPTGGGIPVVRVRGVGEAFEKRLRKEKIRTAGDLAAMDPVELADVLSISEKRAKDLVREAKKTK
jgi:predicted flap endonuclease-1-like 5' DNA nuclease